MSVEKPAISASRNAGPPVKPAGLEPASAILPPPSRRALGAWGELLASYAFVERNFYLVKRYLGWEIVWLVYTIVNTLTIGLIGVEGPAATDQRVLYLVIGAMLWSFLSVLFTVVAEAVAWERWEGTIEYTFMAPVHRITHLGGTCLFGIVYGLVRTVLILGAVAVFFDLDLRRANLGAAFVVLLVSSLAFMGMGLLAAVFPLLSPERGPQATHIIQAILLLVSGVYYDVSVLPSWLQPVAWVSPATYTLSAVRKALLEGAGLAAVGTELLLILVTGVVLIPIGYYAFAWAEAYALRTGKLKRNG